MARQPGGIRARPRRRSLLATTPSPGRPAGPPGMSSAARARARNGQAAQSRTSHRGRAAQAVPAPFPVRGGRLGGSKRQRQPAGTGWRGVAELRRRISCTRTPRRDRSCPGRSGGGRGSKPYEPTVRPPALSSQRATASPSLPGSKQKPGSRSDRRFRG
jgi:hypothetical protein